MSTLEIHTAGGVDTWNLLRWTSVEGDALEQEPPDGSKSTRLPPSPFGMAYPVALPEIGRVYLWADGFTSRAPNILLERELTQRYFKAAGALIKQYARRGAPLESAQAHLQQAQTFIQNRLWLESLVESVCAAEQSVVSIARTRLQRMRGRTAFLWGISSDYSEAVQQSLQVLTSPINLVHLALDDITSSGDGLLQQARSARITVAMSAPRSDSPHSHLETLHEALSCYRGQVRYWSIATHIERYPVSEKTVEALTTLCEAARTVDFGIVRLLHGIQGYSQPRSAYPLLERCVEAGVPFEGIHLEWCWYDGTLLDLDQVLERYGELGKPIHLELTLPPESGYEIFSRTEPLAWLEGACLIALSKPYVVSLRLPLQTTQDSAGMLTKENQISPYWDRICALAAWNRALLD
ncbi:MAG: hypothetical protein N2651_03335 [Fimbriimonadales bacterium]|nr:hypothetical protein [Fimbriimonadales bacterium]